MNTREAIIKCAQRHVDVKTPYEWGGGHHGDSWGLDCSGLVLDCARAAGVDPGYWDSTRMRNELPATSSPQPGDLALYLPRHVVLVEGFDPKTGIATIIGANGGDSSTTSPARAVEQGAKVERRPTHLYRQTFVGFRSIALWGVEDWQKPQLPTSFFLFLAIGALGYWYADKEYRLTDRASAAIGGLL